MFVYQALIMFAVLVVICLIVFVIKIKNRAVLAISILVLAVAGAGAISAVQDYFGTHFYNQSINVSYLKKLKFTSKQEADFGSIFSDYHSISQDKTHPLESIGKTYQVSGNGAQSQVDVNIITFENKTEATRYFDLRQKFYDNKTYLPSNSKQSEKAASDSHKYVTSYIKSIYKDYTDIVFLPSKIAYLSNVIVEDNNVVVLINESANKPVTNKNVVIEDLLKKLGEG
jgi:hypothetical protein